MFAKRNEFIFDVRRKERKGKYIIQFYTKETKRENKRDFTRMIREDKVHFTCEDEEEGYKERRKSIIKKRMDRVINIPETAKREAGNRNNESEQRKPSPSFSKSDKFISIKDKESRRVHL